MRIPRTLLVTLVLTFLAVDAAQADIVWDYLSTDGSDTVTGQLTTSGLPGDELGSAGLSFTLTGITNTFLNSVEVTEWLSSNPPPFLNSPSGSITTVDVTGGAGVSPGSLLVANGPAFFNRMELASPGSGNNTKSRYTFTQDRHYDFAPTSTTFQTTTAVPEPSAFLCLGLVGLGLAGWKRWTTPTSL